MRRILVPVDFSPSSENALNFAVQFSKKIPSEIVLMHSYEKTGSLYSAYVGIDKEFTQQQISEEYAKLKSMEKSIEETEGVNVVVYEYEGPARENILHAVYDKVIDLVIMGTLGNSGTMEQLIGSKTAYVINKCDKPVIAVPFNYNWHAPEKILFATTHFEENELAPGFIFEMAAKFESEVHVLLFTEEEASGKKFMDERKLQLYTFNLREKYPDIPVFAVHLEGHHFEESLRHYADTQHIDLVTMINYHRSFTERLAHPSKTRHMSYLTNIPLLAIPGEPV